MLRKSLALLVLLFLLLPKPVSAIYDPTKTTNNIFGIHILDTSEVSKAAQLVNSTGGDWGYVTIPIRANDRNLPQWTQFMENCRKLHLIPILRIASFPVDPDGTGVNAHWMAPNEYDLVDFANFLDELPWPTHNRYVIIYNEPNHDSEWGGFVYPQEYARVLDRAADIFHKKNQDFFVISAGLDASAPNSTDSENEYAYFAAMNQADPGIFSKIDGFSSHAYGNPGFNSFPNIYSRTNIASYRYEQDYICSNFSVCTIPLFITEAGWRVDLIGETAATNFYTQAFTTIWQEPNIIAITPFLLSAQTGAFSGFSFTDANGNFLPFAVALQQLAKTAGKPQLAPNKPSMQPPAAVSTVLGVRASTDPFGDLFTRLQSQLSNLVRNLFH